MSAFSLGYCSFVLFSFAAGCFVVYALTNGCSMKINEIGCWNTLTGDRKSILDFPSKWPWSNREAFPYCFSRYHAMAGCWEIPSSSSSVICFYPLKNENKTLDDVGSLRWHKEKPHWCWREQGMRLYSTEGCFMLWSVFKPGHWDSTSGISERGNAKIIIISEKVNPKVSFCWNAGVISELKLGCSFCEL